MCTALKLKFHFICQPSSNRKLTRESTSIKFLSGDNEYRDFSPRCQFCGAAADRACIPFFSPFLGPALYIHFDHPGRRWREGRKREERESSLPMQMRSFGIRRPLPLLCSRAKQSKLTERKRDQKSVGGAPPSWKRKILKLSSDTL